MRILIIENDPDLRGLMTEILSGPASDVVGSAQLDGIGRTALGSEQYDVAFTDLVALRHYDGAAARSWVDRVRQLARRVVVVTGHVAAASDGAAVLGADVVVSKPFDVESILAALGPAPA